MKKLLMYMVAATCAGAALAQDRVAFSVRPIREVVPTVVATTTDIRRAESVLTTGQVVAVWSALLPLLERPDIATNHHIVALNFRTKDDGTATITTVWRRD